MRLALAVLALSLLALAVFLAFGRGGRRDGVLVAEKPASAGLSTVRLAETAAAPRAEGLSMPTSPGPPRAVERGVPEEPAPAGEEEVPTELWLRIVSADSAPKPGLVLDVELGDRGRSWVAHTDDAGRLLVLLSAQRRREAPRCLRVRERGPDGLGVRLSLAELAPGRLDLGDVTLARVPVLVSGVVLSPSGAPCEKANIEIQVFDAKGSFADRRRLSTADDGEFEVLDWAQGISRLEFTVRHNSGVNVLGRHIAPGTSGVVVALEEGGALVGHVLVDDPDAFGDLMCHLITSEGNLALRVPVRESGLVPGRIPAGRYSLRLMLAGHPEPLATVDPLVLTNGAVTAPPEINPLDLRGRLRSIGIKATNQDGVPINVKIRHRATGGGASAWTSPAHHNPNPVNLHTAAAALDIEVASEGFRTAVLLGVTEGVHVKLRPGYRVVLALRTPPRMPEDCELTADLDLVQGDRAETRRSNFAGVARFALPEAGEYRVEVTLQGNDIVSTDLVPVPRSIHVLDRDDEQTFVVELDQAEIDAASRLKINW